MKRLLAVLIMIVSVKTVFAQTETPTLPLPTAVMTATPTLTPTPDVLFWATIPAPDGETGQPVVFAYTMDSGQLLTNALLFAILIVNSLTLMFVSRGDKS